MWEPTDQQSTGLADVDDEVFGDDIEIPVDDGDYEWTSLR